MHRYDIEQYKYSIFEYVAGFIPLLWEFEPAPFKLTSCVNFELGPPRSRWKFSDDMASLSTLKHSAVESKVLAYLIAKNTANQGGLK